MADDFVVLKPVAKPKSFSDVKFTQKDWDAAVAAGPVKMWRSGALEALRHAKGLYEVDAPAKQEVEVKVAGMSLSALESTQLKVMAASFGKPIRKKMSRSQLIAFVQGLIDAVPITDDETSDVDGAEDGEVDDEVDGE